MSRDLKIQLAGETVVLLPERALFRPATGDLLVADTHWGKAAAFRAGAVPVPRGTTQHGIRRLDESLARTGAARLLILGDFLHAPEGRAPDTLALLSDWRARHTGVEMVLVRGNHDLRAGDPPAEMEISCVDEPFITPPFVLAHRPGRTVDGYVLAGHIHPGVRLVGRGRQRERLPCFWFGPGVGVLPAFGAFTGQAMVTPASGDRVYVVAEGEVVEIG